LTNKLAYYKFYSSYKSIFPGASVVQQMDRFVNKLVPFFNNNNHSNFYKHTNLPLVFSVLMKTISKGASVVQQMDKFCNKLVPYIIKNKH
jgi:hypothetical protein